MWPLEQPYGSVRPTTLQPIQQARPAPEDCWRVEPTSPLPGVVSLPACYHESFAPHKPIVAGRAAPAPVVDFTGGAEALRTAKWESLPALFARRPHGEGKKCPEWD